MLSQTISARSGRWSDFRMEDVAISASRAPRISSPSITEFQSAVHQVTGSSSGAGVASPSTSQVAEVNLDGRRSRTSSMGGRPRDNTDSSISRESGASLASGKSDKDGIFAFQQSQPALQISNSSPVSASPLPPPSTKGSTSPFPAHPTNDLAKYMDSKLFPFPGMMELERRSKAKAMLNSASSPDINSGTDPASNGSGSSNATEPSPELGRDRKLSHQTSDTRLLAKFNLAAGSSHDCKRLFIVYRLLLNALAPIQCPCHSNPNSDSQTPNYPRRCEETAECQEAPLAQSWVHHKHTRATRSCYQDLND